MFVWSCLSPLSFLLLIHTYFHIHILRTYIHSYMTNCTLKLSSSYISMMSLHAVMMIKALLSCCPATHTYMVLCHLEALFTCTILPFLPPQITSCMYITLCIHYFSLITCMWWECLYTYWVSRLLDHWIIAQSGLFLTANIHSMRRTTCSLLHVQWSVPYVMGVPRIHKELYPYLVWDNVMASYIV